MTVEGGSVLPSNDSHREKGVLIVISRGMDLTIYEGVPKGCDGSLLLAAYITNASGL